MSVGWLTGGSYVLRSESFLECLGVFATLPRIVLQNATATHSRGKNGRNGKGIEMLERFSSGRGDLLSFSYSSTSRPVESLPSLCFTRMMSQREEDEEVEKEEFPMGFAKGTAGKVVLVMVVVGK